MEPKIRSLQEFRQQLDAETDAAHHLDAFRRLRQDSVLKMLDDPEDPDTQGAWEPWEP